MNDPAKNKSPQKSADIDWSAIAASASFKDLVARKKAFIVPAFIFFLIYYLSLAVLVGYAPKLAAMRVIGTVNIAYLFALSQFVVGWAIAALYLLAAAEFDSLAEHIL
ncbi:MAG: DUF485 domain-containing protein, partial [Terriglobales bacterium]